MEVGLIDLCHAFMHGANKLAEACVKLLREMGDDPDKIFLKQNKKRRAARISSKVALTDLPKTVKAVKKMGCTIEDEKATTWKIYIGDDKVGVIKPLTGKMEVMEKVGRETKYRTCTLEELKKVIKKMKKGINYES